MTFTIEHRIAANEAKNQLKEKAKDLRQDWLDEPYWLELYSKYGLRKPAWYLPTTPRYMRKYLKKLNIPVDIYCSSSGFSTLKSYKEHNPKHPLWVWLGMVLEDVEYSVFIQEGDVRTNG
jgi:hypothetical protein